MTTNQVQPESWTPHPFQMKAVQLGIQQASAGFLLDPGLGKTSITLAVFSTLKAAGFVDKMLVITPIKPMYGTWTKEIDKWAEFNHLTWTILHGKDKTSNLEMDADIYLVNPEGMKWLEPHLRSLQCDVLAVDESTKFKNPASKRFKMLRRFIPTFARRYILTGTVCPNGLLDLFSQVYILDEGHALGRYITHYRKQWFDEDWSGYNWTAKEEAMEEISEAIAPLCLQMNAEDYLEMPELITTDIPVTLYADAMKLYNEVESEFIGTLPETGRNVVALSNAAAGGKCRQIAGGAVYVEGKQWELIHTEKRDALLDLLEEIGPQPVVIVYEFQHERERIEAAVEDVVCITGMTGQAYIDLQDEFNLGIIPRLLVHATGTHGLNIQGACHHMVWFNITWDLEAYIQTIDRLYRQGQRSKIVMVYRLVATGTLDETVAIRLTEKNKEQDETNRAIAGFRD